MNIWSIALAAMILTAAVAAKIVNPGYADTGPTTLSGAPVTTLHTPATP